MGFLGRMLLGDGSLKPELRAALEAEGLVHLEQGLSGVLRYDHFRAPGKRFNGKVQPQRVGLGVSESRVVVYCRSGKLKLIDSEYSNPRLEMVAVVVDGEWLRFKVDYDKGEEKNVSGLITISVKTEDAERIAAELGSRMTAGRPR